MGEKENLQLMKTLDDAWSAGPGSPLGRHLGNVIGKMSKYIGQPTPCPQEDDTAMMLKLRFSLFGACACERGEAKEKLPLSLRL